MRRKDEIKVFLSDIICDQVVKISYRNGQIFCIIRGRTNFKKKKIIYIRKHLLIMDKNSISKIATLALLPQYSDIDGMCYDINVQADFSTIPESFFDSFYQTKLPSFQSFQTGKITLSSEDFYKVVKSHHSYINDVCEITGKSYDQVMLDFAEYHKTKEFLIQPNGFSGVIHKLSNGAYVSGAAIQSAFATASSHVSGVTGMSLIGSAPGLIIFVPLVGGVFFASLERMAANTPAQPVLVLARDVCLITPKIAEVAYNEIFIGPVLRKFGIDAPLNITSMLRFGNGTKLIMGGILNATIATITAAVPKP